MAPPLASLVAEVPGVSELDDDDALAAEYALGLLEDAQAMDADRRSASEPAFANRVRYWQRTFAELDTTANLVTPSEDLWGRIAARLAEPEPQGAQTLAARSKQPWRTASIGDIWDSLTFWRATALTTSLASILLAAGLGVSLWRGSAAPVFVAILMTENSNEPAALVNTFADGRAELIPLREIAVPEDRALQIWTLWDRTIGPRPIGLAQAIRTMSLNLSNLPSTGPNQLFEITLEPKTGSPTGRPTGPILMKGLTTSTL